MAIGIFTWCHVVDSGWYMYSWLWQMGDRWAMADENSGGVQSVEKMWVMDWYQKQQRLLTAPLCFVTISFFSFAYSQCNVIPNTQQRPMLQHSSVLTSNWQPINNVWLYQLVTLTSLFSTLIFNYIQSTTMLLFMSIQAFIISQLQRNIAITCCRIYFRQLHQIHNPCLVTHPRIKYLISCLMSCNTLTLVLWYSL